MDRKEIIRMENNKSLALLIEENKQKINQIIVNSELQIVIWNYIFKDYINDFNNIIQQQLNNEIQQRVEQEKTKEEEKPKEEEKTK